MTDQSSDRPPLDMSSEPVVPGHAAVPDDATGGSDGSAETDETTPLPAGEVLAASASAAAMAQPSAPEAAATSDRRRAWWLAGASVLVIVGIVAAFFVVQRSTEPGPKPLIAVDAWVPYWTIDDAAQDLPARDGQLRKVSPFWLAATSAEAIEADPNAGSVDVDDFIAEARRRDNARRADDLGRYRSR